MGKALFWRDKDMVRRMLSTWSAERLASAAERVSRLERELFLSRAPDDANLGETLSVLAWSEENRSTPS